MRKKIVGIVVFMLVATMVVSATNVDVKESNNIRLNSEPYEPAPFEWWRVDQKQTTQGGYGITLIPPETNAQSFTPTKDKLTAVSLYLFGAGTPPDKVNITVSIRDNLTGSDLATKTIDTSVVPITSATWILFDFEDISVTPESKYFIVCSGDAGNANNAYCWLFSSEDLYARGEAWHKATVGSSWIQWPSGSTSPADFCFKTYFRNPLDVSSTPKNNEMMPSEVSMVGDWTETQKLLDPDGGFDIGFGYSISLDGDTALIGCCDDDNGHYSGSAYILIRSGNTWTQQAKLLPSDGEAEEQFGSEACLQGDTALIGAFWDDDNGNHSGSAYVFTRTGTTWTQQQKLLPSDGVTDAQFGISIALDGNTALIGANRDDDNGNRSGSAYVYTRTGTTWTQQAKLNASDGGEEERFGIDVALEGDTALIGAETSDNGDYCGSVYVFTRTGTTWTEQQKLLASDGAAVDWFGFSIALDGNTALFAACLDDDKGTDSGSAYVFTRTGTIWTQQQKLNASDGAGLDHFSENAISLDGDTALIGARYDDDMGSNSGSVYVFTRTGTTWTQQQKLTASDGAKMDMFSWYALSLDGDTAFIGSLYDDNENGNDSGSVYVFTRSSADLTFNITGGIGVKVTISNGGTTDAVDIPWAINVEGGILKMINKTINGTIDVPAGESVTVKSGMFLGIGAIDIAAWVADVVQVTTGKQLLIFTTVKK
jgi:hypothetical protein